MIESVVQSFMNQVPTKPFMNEQLIDDNYGVLFLVYVLMFLRLFRDMLRYGLGYLNDHRKKI